MFPFLQSETVLRARGSMAFIVGTVTFAIFTDDLLYCIIVPVVPYAFVDRMGIPEEDVQSWVSRSLAIYSAGMIVGSLVFGWLCDKLGHRRICMLIGLVLLIASTIILCVSRTIWLFQIGRALSGLSASVVWSAGMAVIADSAPVGRVGTLLAIPGLGMSIAKFIAPMLGGVIYHQAGYYAVFYLCFGMLAIDIALRILMIEKNDLSKRLQAKGVIEAAPMMTEVINTADAKKYSSYLWGHELPPVLTLLAYPRIWNGLFQAFMASWFMTGLDATLPVHMKNDFQFDSLQTGLIWLAVAIPLFAQPGAGWLCDRIGSKWVQVSGLLLLIPAFILLRIPMEPSPKMLALFVVLLVILGFALCLVNAPMMSEMTSTILAIEKTQPGKFGKSKGFGQAYGLMNVAIAVGGIAGPFQGEAANAAGGWNAVSLCLGLLAAATAIPSFMFTGNDLTLKLRKRSDPGPNPNPAPAPDPEWAEKPAA